MRLGMTPMIALIMAALVLTLAGCQDNRVPVLEKRVTDLESKVNSLKEKQQEKSDADSANAARFKQCVYSADDNFDSALRLNGTKNQNGCMRFRQAPCKSFSVRNRAS